uniref:BolA-like protein n=1 Tax=Meloidogyne hapla TaxID=6305 RepID=A0A1I8BZ64_MELHA
MTLTKKQQNKPIPIELLSEISKSIIGYPKLVKNKEIDDTSNHEKYAVKIQFCGNVLISSKIIYLFCGKDLKQILKGFDTISRQIHGILCCQVLRREYQLKQALRKDP